MNVCKGLLVAPADSRHLTFVSEIVFPDVEVHLTLAMAFPGGEPGIIIDSCHPLDYVPRVEEMKEYVERMIQDMIRIQPESPHRYDIVCREDVDLSAVVDLLVARVPPRTNVPEMREDILNYLERCEMKGSEA